MQTLTSKGRKGIVRVLLVEVDEQAPRPSGPPSPLGTNAAIFFKHKNVSLDSSLSRRTGSTCTWWTGDEEQWRSEDEETDDIVPGGPPWSWSNNSPRTHDHHRSQPSSQATSICKAEAESAEPDMICRRRTAGRTLIHRTSSKVKPSCSSDYHYVT